MLKEYYDCFQLEDGTFVPKSEENPDYREILKRIEAGEEYEPYDAENDLIRNPKN